MNPLSDDPKRNGSAEVELDPVMQQREWQELADAVRQIADHEVGRETGDTNGPEPHVWARVKEHARLYNLTGDEGFEGLDPKSRTRQVMKIVIVELQKYVASPQFMDDFQDTPIVDESGKPIMEVRHVPGPDGIEMVQVERQKIHLAQDKRHEWAETNLLHNEWAEKKGLPVGDKLYKFFRNHPFKVTILASAQNAIKSLAKDIKELGLDTSPEGRALCELADSYGKPEGIHDMDKYADWRDKAKGISNMTLWDEIPPKERWDIADQYAISFRKFLDAIEATSRDYLKLGDY